MIEALKVVSRGHLALHVACFFLVTLTLPLHFASAHEVETNRLSLVQREPSHVSATFYVSPFDYFQPVRLPNNWPMSIWPAWMMRFLQLCTRVRKHITNKKSRSK